MSRRFYGATREPPPEGEPQLFLWVVALLIAVLELTWWLFDRMYST